MSCSMKKSKPQNKRGPISIMRIIHNHMLKVVGNFNYVNDKSQLQILNFIIYELWNYNWNTCQSIPIYRSISTCPGWISRHMMFCKELSTPVVADASDGGNLWLWETSPKNTVFDMQGTGLHHTSYFIYLLIWRK